MDFRNDLAKEAVELPPNLERDNVDNGCAATADRLDRKNEEVKEKCDSNKAVCRIKRKRQQINRIIRSGNDFLLLSSIVENKELIQQRSIKATKVDNMLFYRYISRKSIYSKRIRKAAEEEEEEIQTTIAYLFLHFSLCKLYFSNLILITEITLFLCVCFWWWISRLKFDLYAPSSLHNLELWWRMTRGETESLICHKH